jgi:hypothetical protein
LDNLKEGYLFVLPLFSGILTLVLFCDGLWIYAIHSLGITVGILFIKWLNEKK